MATSGSRDFKLTRDNLIRRAFQCATLYDLQTAIPSDDINFASDLLNSMLKHWQAAHIHLWNRKEATLFCQLNTKEYSLGSTGDHATESYVSTQVATAASSGASTLIVDSTTGMSASDNIGIELDDGTRQWTTISTVDSSTQVTLSGTLNDDVAVDKYVVAYTTKIARPVLILNARWQLLSNLNNEIECQAFRRNDYFAVSDKLAAGAPNRYYYDKQLDNGVLYVFQRPDDANYIINFSYYEDVEDMDSSTDNFDYPKEWTSAIIWNLATELAIAYGLPQIAQLTAAKGGMLYKQLTQFDYDEESIMITPKKDNN